MSMSHRTVILEDSFFSAERLNDAPPVDQTAFDILCLTQMSGDLSNDRNIAEVRTDKAEAVDTCFNQAVEDL